jgi:small-conductance mechanosensitive channel
MNRVKNFFPLRVLLLFILTFAGFAQGLQAIRLKEVPVVPFNDTIFYIYTKLGPYSPDARALNIEKRMQELAGEIMFSSDSLMIVSDGHILDIVYNDVIIMSVTDADTVFFHQSKNDIATYYKQAIAQSVNQYREDTGWIKILTKTGLIVLIIGIFFFVVRSINKLLRFINKKISASKGTRIKGITVKSYNLLDEAKATSSILFVLKIIKYICLIIVFYFTVTLVFSVFPETRGLAGQLLSYVTTPLSRIAWSIIHYIPKAVTIVIIVFVFRYLIRGIKYFAGEIEKGKLTINGFYPDWAMPTYNIIRTLLYAFMFILIFPYLPQSESKIFQGVSVFIGVIISLGSTSLIGNLIAGLVLTYMRPFKIGDNIKIGEIHGTVTEKTPFVTRIRTLKNEEVTIPNSNIMSAYTINYTNSSQKHQLILYKSITLGYEIPWRQAHELLLKAAGQTACVLQDPKPFVLQRGMDDFYVEYQINIYVVEDKQMMSIYSELYQNIQDVFNEAGIEIMSPHYYAKRDGSEITIPKAYLKKE